MGISAFLYKILFSGKHFRRKEGVIMQLAGSQTLQNIKTAFLGESQATIKYYIYGNIAKKDGYQQIKGAFENIAHNEYAHAQTLLSLISEGIPANTAKALENAAGGEHYEWAEAYAGFSKTATRALTTSPTFSI